jgi:hypothetical protein
MMVMMMICPRRLMMQQLLLWMWTTWLFWIFCDEGEGT